MGYEDGSLTDAKFNNLDVALGPDGNVYVADRFNHVIRKIDVSNGTVSTVAGNGSQGSDDGLNEVSSFNNPMGIILDTSEAYIADSYNHKIRKISSGVVYFCR